MTTTNEAQLFTAAAVSDQLHISPDTLRRWTREFAAQLSASAVGSGYYRYSTIDVKRLQTIRDLLAEGKTSDEVSKQLAAPPVEETPPAEDHEPLTAPASEKQSSAVVIHTEDSSSNQNPATMVLREVLTGFASGQEAILNSQQANRNLMGVVIQDNFNLKEENARLRDRMLKLEQEMNELRRLQAEQRTLLDQRLRQFEQRQAEQKKDWLSRLLGY